MSRIDYRKLAANDYDAERGEPGYADLLKPRFGAPIDGYVIIECPKCKATMQWPKDGPFMPSCKFEHVGGSVEMVEVTNG